MKFVKKPNALRPDTVDLLCSANLEVPVVLKDGAKMPSYACDASSGVDLCAFLKKPVTLEVGQRLLIPTGLFMEIPEGYEAQIRSRSGLALKYGVVVLNSPGTIDAGYRGEIQVLLMNFGQESFVVEPGMRMAQCVFAAVSQVRFQAVMALGSSDRQGGGFGSTGLS